jgi:tetrahydromethanopterin S-methyltransferase subunit H
VHSFSTEQVTIEIPTESGTVRIGGRPGLIPTAMVGSIFYAGDKLVLDAKTGKVDKEKTEKILDRVADVSARTGIPNILDVVAETTDAVRAYVGYLCDITDMPLMIDGSGSLEVNLAGLEAANEFGIMDRIILNSIGPEDKEDVYQKLKNLGLKTAMLLAFTSDAMASSDKRVILAKELIERASKAGVKNLMVDTGVMDLLTLGLSTKAIYRIKDETGVPSGCGAHNAVNMWEGLVPKYGKEAKKPAMVGASIIPVTMGADFILYGPVKNAPIIFPSIAMVDVALSGGLLEEGKRPKRPHPRYLIG